MSGPIRHDDSAILARLLDGDEESYVALVRRHQPAMLVLARSFVASPVMAEEVVQETWSAVLEGLPGFEGRCSLRAWIFTILTNRARTRAARENRFVAVAGLGSEDGPAVPAHRFDARGMWVDPPGVWQVHGGEAQLVRAETIQRLAECVERLPDRQKAVLLLRDAEGFTPVEVEGLLGLTPGNQRVLLHRARSRVRLDLEAAERGGRC